MTEPDLYTEQIVARLQGSNWVLKSWSASSALFAKDGGHATKFNGQTFDPKKYDLVEAGWGHDHCPFCWVTISDRPWPQYVSEAYTNGYDWLCPACYAKHLQRA